MAPTGESKDTGGVPEPIERFQTYKTGALFAYLAYFLQTRHSRETLATMLWPDAPVEAARNRLTQALVWLRPRLEWADRGAAIFADRLVIGLDPLTFRTDVLDFEAALREADAATAAGDESGAANALRRAVAGYSGDLLPDHHEEWVFGERERLRSAYLDALRRLTVYHERLGDLDTALDLARSAVTADPLMEEAHGDLIRLLALAGRPAAALRQYRELERALNDAFGEPPAPELRALAERVRRGDPTLVRPPSVSTAERSAESGASDNANGADLMPVPLTRFFGRTVEVERLRNLLADSSDARLITLIGPGGNGKTRLAVEVARRVASDYAGAVWFVPLSDVPDVASVPAAIVAAMRLPNGSVGGAAATTNLERVAERLSYRRSLLVLDNIEHLVGTDAPSIVPLLHDLLTRCPRLTLLMTSRQRLGLEGEREIAVPPLSLPDRDDDTPHASEAVQLYVDRAQAVRPVFRLTQHNTAAVSAVCARLEGNPLAIELCAAWAQTLTPAQTLEQLAHPLDLLVSRTTDVPGQQRHRSLRDALEYSYRLLTPELQHAFCQLSVFRRGWTLEAAVAFFASEEAGTNALLPTLERLTALRERSLITVEEEGEDESGAGESAAMRYRMLETLRDFAFDRLSAEGGPAEVARLRERHARLFLRLTEPAPENPSIEEDEATLRRLETAHDNLNAALSWAVETGAAGDQAAVEVGLRLAGALAAFWDARGHLGEGAAWLERLLALPGARSVEPRVRARALTAFGQLTRNQGRSEVVDAAMDEALRLWREIGDERGLATCLQALATITYSREGEAGTATARAYLNEGLDLARRLHNRALTARSLLNLGNIGLAHGEWEQAHLYYTESLALYRDAGNRSRCANVLSNLGLLARYRGDLSQALPLLEEAHRIAQELGNRAVMAVTAINRATVLRLAGEYDRALPLLRQAARWAAESGDRRLLPWCVRESGHIACGQGDYTNGIRLLSAAEVQRLAMGITFRPADPEELERAAAAARAAVGEGSFAAAWAAGSALPRAQVYAEALHLSPDA